MQKINRLRFLLLVVAGVYKSSLLVGQDSLTLQSLEQKARASYGSNLDSSMYYAQQILNYDSLQTIPKYQAFALNWMGICLMRKGYPDSAEAYYKKTIAYSKAKGVTKYEHMARLNRSINFWQQGYFEQGAKAAEESLHAFEALGDSLGMAHAQYNLGNCLFQLGRPEEALTFYHAALKMYLKNEAILPVSNTYNAIGSVYQQREDYEKSIEFFRESVANKIAVGGENFCASEYINIGTSYKNLQLPDSARWYYHKAMEVAGKLGDQQKLANAAIDLAILYNETGRPDSAEYFGKKGTEIARLINDKYLLYKGLYQMAVANNAQGNAALAFAQLQASKELEDSISNKEIKAQVVALEKKFKLAEKDKELLNKQLVIAGKQKSIQFQRGLLIMLVLLMAVGLIWFRAHRMQQKLKQQEILQNERSRIAMDLHDHVGAELTLVSSRLDTRIFKTERPKEKEDLGSIANQVRNVSSILRETVWSISEEVITTGQLKDRIEAFALKHIDEAAIAFDSTTNNEELELNPQLALTLYRIMQEGIANALKYARATAIQLTIDKQQGKLALTLIDNGTGFDLDTVKKGYGLFNMQQRTEQLGGEFHLSSQAGKGVTIQVIVPI